MGKRGYAIQMMMSECWRCWP